MSAPTPSRLIDLAPPDAVPRVGEHFDALSAGLSPEDYFVLTRIDGRTTLKELFLSSGLAELAFVRAASKLQAVGALVLPGGAGSKPAAATPTAAKAPAVRAPSTAPDDDDTGFGVDGSVGSVSFGSMAASLPGVSPPRRAAAPRSAAAGDPIPIPLAVPETVSDAASGAFKLAPGSSGGSSARRFESSPRLESDGVDLAAIGEENDLTQEQRRTILLMEHVVRTGTLYDMLDSRPEASHKDIRRAYFRISKDFHPDRYYGKNLGSFQGRLALIFERASRAWAVLGDDAQRASYDGRAARPESPAEQAQRIYKEACDSEIGGDLERAVALFDAAIRVDGKQPKILRRAVEVLLRQAAEAAGVQGGIGADPVRLSESLARALGPGGVASAGVPAKTLESLKRAQSYAKTAAEFSPPDAASLRTLSRVLRAGADLDGARRALERALHLDPNNEHISAELDQIVRQLLEPTLA